MVFPADHPDHPECIGAHNLAHPCDGIRGKHPAVAWSTWRVVTPPMLDTAWEKRGGLANTGVSCGPSGIVVLDEDKLGELDRWLADYNRTAKNKITLPPTYTVTTARGRHVYFRWDHAAQPIGNREKAFQGYKINVRGDGGYVIGHGSKHESGAIYTGNGLPIAELREQVAEILLYAIGTPATNGAEVATAASFFEPPRNPNTERIPFGKRHAELVAYAGRLRKLGLDYHEAEAAFRARWLLCEQPEGPEGMLVHPHEVTGGLKIVEPPFRSAACPYPVTWEQAQQKLASVYSLYPAGATEASLSAASGAEHSWRAVDLEAVLSGHWEAPKPTVGQRSDGVGLFYPGKVHTVASESEAGKTWLVLGAAFHELEAGHAVLYLDFEDDEGGVVGRLLTMQLAPETIRSRFRYLRPAEALGNGANLGDLFAIVATDRPTIAVIDGVTEAMTMHGLDPLNNKDIATFGRILPRRLAATGAATACLDHVSKATDRGRYALGGVHKLNGLDGAAYLLENREPFGIGREGRSTVLIAKDRPGQLRKHGRKRKDGLCDFGELRVTSHDESYVEFEILPALAAHGGEFRPVKLMAKICAAIDEHGAMPQRQILATVGGRRQYAIDALALLQRDGYVSEESPHKLLKPWDEW